VSEERRRQLAKDLLVYRILLACAGALAVAYAVILAGVIMLAAGV
jgi:hypothetical protein